MKRTIRHEQLRQAKRAQREREREAGLTTARLKLPVTVAERLAFASRQPGFEGALTAFLEKDTIQIAHFPQLARLCWNRRGRFLSAHEAWDLYERNWRFIERETLEPQELGLMRALATRFGGGIINV